MCVSKEELADVRQQAGMDSFVTDNRCWRSDQPAGTTLTCMFGLLALVKAVAQSCKDAMALPPRQACVYTAAEFTMPAVSYLHKA